MSHGETLSLNVATYNIHKGFSQFNQRMMVYELRRQLRELSPDIVFLQEVQGRNRRHAKHIDDWPQKAQHRFLAEDNWQASAYGHNVVNARGHYGNAILSRFPIVDVFNQDVTHLSFERRGLLHCRIEMPGLAQSLHCVCVHLSLFARSRRRQIDALSVRLEEIVGADSPLIVAGDFNDWRNEADTLLADRLGLDEVLAGSDGDPGRSFPARLPMLRLDRIYVRGFSVRKAQVHTGGPWSKISDHAALSAQIELAAKRNGTPLQTAFPLS